MTIAEPISQAEWNESFSVADRSNQITPAAPHVDWDFAGHDTQYSTHGLHTYVAAMIPALARRLIDMYIPANGSVLDPFCGGGAVLVESIRSGRSAYGRDINHLAILVSQAKTQFIPVEDISLQGSKILKHALNYDGPELRFPKSAVVEYWFKDYMLTPLTGLRKAIDCIPDDQKEVKTLFQVLLSATVRSVSLTYRNEVRLRRMKPDDQATFNPDVLSTFRKYLLLAQERVPSLPLESYTHIRSQDVRNLDIPDESIDGIVCSPPYGDERNGVNYTQFAKNMLYWLGFTRDSIRDSKNRSLGWGSESRGIPPSSTLVHSLDYISDNPTAVREAIAFYSDYHQALKEMSRVARGHVVIVIGNRVLHQHVFDNAKITEDLMQSIGVSMSALHPRKLPTKRLPKMREHGAAIDKESILVFTK